MGLMTRSGRNRACVLTADPEPDLAVEVPEIRFLTQIAPGNLVTDSPI